MLSKKPTITAIVKARQEFLAINMSAGMTPGSDQHQALSKQSVKQLQDALLSLRHIDATDAATVMQTLPLPTGQAQHRRSQTQDPDQTPRPKTQTPTWGQRCTFQGHDREAACSDFKLAMGFMS